MATGVNVNERLGPDAIVALPTERKLHPLPALGEQMSLQYCGRLSEEDVLAAIPEKLARVDTQSLATFPSSSVEPNALIYSDNFLALQSLVSTGTRADLVYLDPPYGTGMDFQSRCLSHAFADKLDPCMYIEFMRRRLILIRECMTESASIYLHIGHQMLGHIKVIMDEIFGQQQFRNLISRRKCSSKNYTRNSYANLNDYILYYTKGQNFTWHQPGSTPRDEWILKEYPKLDHRGRYKLVPVHAPGIRNGETGKPWRGRLPPPGKHWQYTPARLDEFDANSEIHWSKNNNPRRKVYWYKSKKVPYTDHWEGFRDAHHQSILITGYPTEKNLTMLEMIVGASSNPGDLVLDPFCGSGTTLEAAHRQGRAWIGIDESSAAIQATFKRLCKGRSPMGDYVNRSSQTESASNSSLFDICDGTTQNCERLERQLPCKFDMYADGKNAQHLLDMLDNEELEY